MESYDHKAIEPKWQKTWQDTELYKVADTVPGKDNFYTLVEFSYPSGNLHTGHWYAFAVPDMFARYKRMQGYNVLYPMGFDAFGLPAENAAIKLGADPKVLTYEQMDRMRTQLRSMGAMFDWSREVVTCDPSYYKWTQWMFNKFLEKDLVYRDTTLVNWCPKDQTILANEQVVDGKCERCGTEVVQRQQQQWMLRITKFADQLLDDLDTLDWPHAIKEAQRNWIGRSEGALVKFRIAERDTSIEVFTTRIDTIMGVTFVVLAPEHKLVQELLAHVTNKDAVMAYIEATQKKSELDRQQSKDKTGVKLESVSVINPANNEEVPVYIADYVLAGYGTGAVMGVPQHDERDREFATALGIRIVDQPLVDTFETIKKVGAVPTKTYRLRDWGISRQRYWGTPIPIVYDPEGKPHAIPDEHLPWLLPTDVDHTPDGTAPLARSKELIERTERIFGAGWKPEVETMDAFVDSTWYFYRYLDHANEWTFAAPEKRAAWMPIDLYMGGAEHTTMHVLYSRFWTKALHQLGLVQENESFKIRRNRGLILGPDGNKMSKSKGNVINPDEIVERLGADTVRMYLGFMGPYNTPVNYPWDPNGVVGVRRFLERVWKLKDKIGAGEVTPLLHKTIKKVTDDIEEYKFNTSIAAMMSLVNEWEKKPAILEGEYRTLLKLLAPFAPHISEELWHQLPDERSDAHYGTARPSIHTTEWPEYNPTLLIDESVTIGVQINGKLRAQITHAQDVTKDALRDQVLALPRIQELTAGKTVQNMIIVPGKIINIVVV